MITYFPVVSLELNDALRMPTSNYGLIVQFTIFGLIRPDSMILLDTNLLYWVRWIPPAWSLNIELLFYIVIAFFVRGRYVAIGLWLLSSVAIYIYLLWHGEVAFTYFTLLGPSVCFSLGAALTWLKRSRLVGFLNHHRGIPIALFATIAALLIFCRHYALGQDDLSSRLSNLVLLLSVPVSVACLASIIEFRHRTTQPRAIFVERIAADLSYPLFLIHWPAAVLCRSLFEGIPEEGLGLLAVSLPVCLILSWFIVVLVEHPLQPLRGRIRETTPRFPGPATLGSAER